MKHRPILYGLHLSRHQKMLDLQEKIKPFTPTIRELQEAWELSTTSLVVATLHRLENMNCVITKPDNSGKGRRYYAVPRPIDDLIPMDEADREGRWASVGDIH